MYFCIEVYMFVYAVTMISMQNAACDYSAVFLLYQQITLIMTAFGLNEFLANAVAIC